MPHPIVGTENSAPIEIHYEDHGGPVVLIHGYRPTLLEFVAGKTPVAA